MLSKFKTLRKRGYTTEAEVLKKLGIPDFRHISKDTIMQFCGMLDGMDPEVAMKAIEQFPNFAITAKEALVECQATIREIVGSSSESLNKYYEMCNRIIDGLMEMLKDEDLSFDEKKYVIEQMREVEMNMGRKDSEHKRHNERIAVITGVCTGFIVIAMTAVLGGKVDIEFPKVLEGSAA